MSKPRKRRRNEHSSKAREPNARGKGGAGDGRKDRDGKKDAEKARPSKKGFGILGWVILFVAVYFGGQQVRKWIDGRRGQPDTSAPRTQLDRELERAAEDRRTHAEELLQKSDEVGAADALRGAVLLFEKAGADDVTIAPARRQLAEVLLRLGRSEELDPYLRAWVPLYPGETWPNEFLAESLFRRGLYVEARKAIDAILAIAPKDTAALRKRVEILARMAASAEIPAAVDAALSSPAGGDRETRIQCLRALLAIRDYDRLLPLADGLLAGEPENRLFAFARGAALARRGEYDRAEKDLKAAESDPEIGDDARYELGLAALHSGRAQEALRTFGEILIRDPTDTRAAAQYATTAKRLGLDDQAGIAEAYLAEIRPTETGKMQAESLERAGEPIEAALARASRLELIDRISEAEAALEPVAEAFPTDPRPRIALAKTRLFRGLAQEAIETIEGVETPEALIVRARALAKLGRRDDAIAALEAAARDPASRAGASLELGEILLDPSGPRPLEAQAWFEEALDDSPAAAHFGLARARYALDEGRAALDDLAAAGDASGLPVASWRVRILVALGRWPEAEAARAAVPSEERRGTIFLEARAAILLQKGDARAEPAAADLEAARARDERIRGLERDLASSRCPDAARILDALSRVCSASEANARATHFAMLAADCDPADAEAPALVADASRHPVLAFRELHWLERRVALAPEDGEAKARIAALRERLALGAAETAAR
ncbi:MAG: hypothetical protein JXP34_09165 [Planctomycetes bacterium]|nr:hypothetical protein [Planctomycetota bacterium]